MQRSYMELLTRKLERFMLKNKPALFSRNHLKEFEKVCRINHDYRFNKYIYLRGKIKMWTRDEIKSKAKDALRGSYWSAFAVSLVIGISTAGFNFRWSTSFNRNSTTNNYDDYGSSFSPEDTKILLIGALIVLAIFLLALIFKVFVGYMLEVGGRKYFIRLAEGESNMSYLGYCFKSGRYLSVLGTMLVRSIFTFLWFLLLIIPGIIKSYSYKMVPYILADNPSIGAMRAIELSNNMTKGEKWNMFVLDLSFIGWYLLGFLACCIGIIFVTPYFNATQGELYLVLRKNAIETGLTSNAELNLTSEIDLDFKK